MPRTQVEPFGVRADLPANTALGTGSRAFNPIAIYRAQHFPHFAFSVWSPAAMLIDGAAPPTRHPQPVRKQQAGTWASSSSTLTRFICGSEPMPSPGSRDPAYHSTLIHSPDGVSPPQSNQITPATAFMRRCGQPNRRRSSNTPILLIPTRQPVRIACGTPRAARIRSGPFRLRRCRRYFGAAVTA